MRGGLVPSQLDCAGGRGSRGTSWEVTAAMRARSATQVVAVEIQRRGIHSACGAQGGKPGERAGGGKYKKSV